MIVETRSVRKYKRRDKEKRKLACSRSLQLVHRPRGLLASEVSLCQYHITMDRLRKRARCIRWVSRPTQFPLSTRVLHSSTSLSFRLCTSAVDSGIEVGRGMTFFSRGVPRTIGARYKRTDSSSWSSPVLSFLALIKRSDHPPRSEALLI